MEYRVLMAHLQSVRYPKMHFTEKMVSLHFWRCVMLQT